MTTVQVFLNGELRQEFYTNEKISNISVRITNEKKMQQIGWEDLG